MNFPSFGSHFSASIPSIQQFAAKFGHDNTGNVIGATQDCVSNRYTTNAVVSFGQHSTVNQQQIITTPKYPQNMSYINQSNFTNDKRQNYDQTQQQMYSSILQNEHDHKNQQQTSPVQEKLKEERQEARNQSQNNQSLANTISSWQSLAATGTSVADYLSHLPATTIPLSLHHFLKYSAENIKKETAQLNSSNTLENSLDILANEINIPVQPNIIKKKKKKKSTKEKKPRPKPGEIRLTTALDGSTLYCCPECHMAYPERELLEQHLVGHTMERKFVCDICGAGLKRKDHLTRHKQSHNPDRPYVCNVCLKAFKRKEQLTLHFVIHSGEKRHVCTECGKGFYRKDHLRKHTRSHIARRVKAELSQQGNNLHGMIAGSSNNSQVLLS